MKTSRSYQIRVTLVRAIPYAAALILGVAVYLWAAAGPFIWDDHFLLDQLRGQEGNSVLNAFTSGFMVRPTGEADFYRPMVVLSLIFDRALWGGNSVGYHVTNLVLHAASIAMVALFAWLLLRSRAAAIAAAFLFAVHPVHAESVCWISGRTDLICAVFLLGGLNCFLIYRTGRSGAMLAASLLLVALALLSKELAAVVPVLVCLSAWGAGERSWKRILLHALPFAVLVVMYIGIRTYVLGDVEPLTEPFPPFHQASVIAYSVFTHFQILVLPHMAHLCYQVVSQEIANANTFIMLGSVAVLTWFLWSYRRTAPIPFFGMAWFFVTILPISALAGWQLSTIVSQRFLYLPSVGLAVVFGWAVAYVLRQSLLLRAAGVGIAAVVLLAFSVLSLQQSRLWTNQVVFWEQFVRDTPITGDSYYHLGLAYHRAGNYKKSIKAHQVAAQLMPDRPEPDYGLGEAYKALGDYDRAQEHYSLALELSPGSSMLREKLNEALRAKE